MLVNVHMLAFQPQEGVIRPVNIPDGYRDPEPDGSSCDLVKVTLDAVFHYGQNEIQPVPGVCSVSAGDVAELAQPDGGSKFYLFQPVGARELSPAELQQYRALPRRERIFSQFVRGSES